MKSTRIFLLLSLIVFSAPALPEDDPVTTAAEKLIEACHEMVRALDAADGDPPTSTRKTFLGCASFFDRMAGLKGLSS